MTLRARPSARPRSRARVVRRGWCALAAVLAAAGAGAAVTRDPRVIPRLAGRWAVYRAGGQMLAGADVVLQAGPSDCGPAALAHALRLGGYRTPSLATLARLAHTTAAGTSLPRLAAAAGLLGAPARLIVGAGARFTGATPPAPPPLVAWVDRSHFVVLERVTARGVQIADPAVGRYLLPRPALRRRWSDAVLAVPPRRRIP